MHSIDKGFVKRNRFTILSIGMQNEPLFSTICPHDLKKKKFFFFLEKIYIKVLLII